MDNKNVVSLELSKKLKETGYPQEGGFWWVKLHSDWAYCITHNSSDNMKLRESGDKCVALLASELMERLPSMIKCGKWEHMLKIMKINDRGNFSIGYVNSECRNIETCLCETIIIDNFCNGLARMYIYLAEHNLLTKGERCNTEKSQ